MPFVEDADAKQSDGWIYHGTPTGGDHRKLVTLVQDGMTWVGIRVFSQADQRWMNNNEPERAQVKAWQDLVSPADGFWQGGKLFIRCPDNTP
jgi:hypothetical protein